MFQDIQIKSNEAEFNSYNAQFLKRWKIFNDVNWENTGQSFISKFFKDKNSPYSQHLNGSSSNKFSGKELSTWDYTNVQINMNKIPHMEENKITE